MHMDLGCSSPGCVVVAVDADVLVTLVVQGHKRHMHIHLTMMEIVPMF